MEALEPYLLIGAVIAVLFAWSWHFHSWSSSLAARRSRSPLWAGFSATAASAVFVIAGLAGYNLSKRSRFLTGSGWTDDVIWWEVVVGLVLVPVAIYFLRRGADDMNQRLSHTGTSAR